MEIYSPAEDSFLLKEFLEDYLSKNKIKTYLDMGTGSGILSQAASKFLKKENILATDINKESIEFVSKKGFRTIQSNLFSNINKQARFDLITFNAPYLPQTKNEPKGSELITTGGKRGDEVSLKFLKQAKKYLSEGGKIFLLVSSLTPLKRIEKFTPKIIARKKVFFEELLILEFNR